MTTKPFLTTEEAAERLELTPRQVQYLIKAELLPGAMRVGKGSRSPYIIPIESVDALVAQRKAAKEAKQKRARGKRPRAR